tara:strand:+ start:871 stop:1443 length:573 start_codon:yes stop_codon:yes gene_type:complete
MRNIYIITGPIGSGKSSACKFLKKHGFKYINSDKFAKDIIRSNKTIKKNISRLLNLHKDLSGRIPWKKIRNFISNNTENKRKYNAIIHDVFYKLLNEKINNEYDYVIEIPLIETIDKIKQKKTIICILTDYKNRKERFVKNKYKNEPQFETLNKLQESHEFYVKNSDYVIYNNKRIDAMNNKLISIINKP